VIARAAEPRDGSGEVDQRVTTLELFFDLVFVFTLTQLTAMIEHDLSIETLLRVVLIFTVLFWMYGGYVWLTNQVPPTTTAARLLIIGGMAAFLVCALAVPHAFDRDGVAFGIGYLFVILIHGGMFAHAYGRAALGFVPFNIVGAVMILAAGVVGGTAAYLLWTGVLVLQFASSFLTRRDRNVYASGLALRRAHFVERHGLLLLVAFGESVVAIGIGLANVELDARMYVAAVLGLALIAALWWTYFAGDDERALEALEAAPVERHIGVALDAFFYGFVPMLLGIVILAAGVALTIAAVETQAAFEVAALVSGGAALYLAGDLLLRYFVGIAPLRFRAAAIPIVFATIPVGVFVSGLAQLIALIACFVAVLLSEQRSAGSTVSAPG
jgi:low temperature requirement protein LtrA